MVGVVPQVEFKLTLPARNASHWRRSIALNAPPALAAGNARGTCARARVVTYDSPLGARGRGGMPWHSCC